MADCPRYILPSNLTVVIGVRALVYRRDVIPASPERGIGAPLTLDVSTLRHGLVGGVVGSVE